jgi:DNA helicase-2/ATP-dependent DNA helicase PcrA
MELTRRGIPFQITSGLRFFEQAHIKDVAAFLKFAVNPRDEVAFKRMVRLLPGIGARSAESLWNDAASAVGSDPAAFSKLHELKVPPRRESVGSTGSHTRGDHSERSTRTAG